MSTLQNSRFSHTTVSGLKSVSRIYFEMRKIVRAEKNISKSFTAKCLFIKDQEDNIQ